MREQGHKWSQATVWSVEKGERPLRLVEALDLSSMFMVPPELLWQMEDTVAVAAMLNSAIRRMWSVRTRAASLGERWDEATTELAEAIELAEQSGIEPDGRAAAKTASNLLHQAKWLLGVSDLNGIMGIVEGRIDTHE